MVLNYGKIFKGFIVESWIFVASLVHGDEIFEEFQNGVRNFLLISTKCWNILGISGLLQEKDAAYIRSLVIFPFLNALKLRKVG